MKNPQIDRAIAHWKKEMEASRAQIASGAFPQHDENCRRYIWECRRCIRKLEETVDAVIARNNPTRTAPSWKNYAQQYT